MTFARALLFLALVGWSALALAGPPRSDGAVISFGTPAPGEPGRVIRIDASTRFINIEHYEVATITNQHGHSFSWRFDTGHVPTGFPLRRVAPPGFEAGVVWVYIDSARFPGP